ncbi:STAS domain-containing protein [Actinomadura sp. 21ATH]|uniref:STAS domain-containing protein n=1 Tax=Actinomadura sp. 21ATH TaxID=1735444 RepID=UPI0035C14FEF
MKLIVGVTSVGSWRVVELRGDLDVATASAVVDQVGQLLGMVSRPRVALELSQVAFCDSSGLNAFVRLWTRAKAVGGELVLVRFGPRVAELLARTRVDGHVRILDSPDDVSEGGPAATEPACPVALTP